METSASCESPSAPLSYSTANGALTRDVFVTYGTSAVKVGLGVILGVITARMLGPHNRGVFALVYLLPATVVTLVKLGLSQASVYSIRRDHVAPERVVANAFIVAWVIGTVAIVLAVVFRERLLATVLRGVPQWAMLMALPMIPLLLFESYFFAILQALGRFGLYNTRNLLGMVLLVLGMLIFLVGFRGGLRAAMAVVICVRVVMDSWLLFSMRRWLGFAWRLDLPLLRREIRFGLKSHIQVLAQHLHLRADTYLVAYFLNPAQVAFYVLAVRLAELMLDIPESVGMVLYPRLVSLDDRAMHALTAQACRRTVLLTAIGAALLAFIGPALIVLWYGPDYAPASQPLRVVAVGIVMMSVFVLLTRNFTSRNKQQVNTGAGVVALAGNIVLNVFLIPRLGITGAAVASTISYSVAAALLIACFRRESQCSLRDVLVAKPEDLRFFWNLGVRVVGRGKQLVFG
jgi:O-antigen/teichoic acid export membrane protein